MSSSALLGDLRLMGAAMVLGSALLTTGCGDDFAPASLVDNTRIIGVETTVLGSETDGRTRAWPRPGEELRHRLVLVGPEPTLPDMGVVMVACPDLEVPRGGGQCAGDAFAFVGDGSLGPVVDEFVYTVPSAEAFTDIPRIRVFGALCPGAALVPPEGFAGGLFGEDLALALDEACTPAEGEDPIIFGLEVEVAVAEESNFNPRLAADAFAFQGQRWPAAAELSCADAGSEALPRVSRGPLDEKAADVLFGVRIDDADRESFLEVLADTVNPESRRETLQLSAFTTFGELNQQFLFFDDESGATGELTWRPDEELETVDPNGQLVRIRFVLRDGRGGLTETERAFCLFP